MRVLGHWWNGVTDQRERKDVWAERLDDGRFQVRWRGGEFHDRDGSYRTSDERIAMTAVRALVGDPADGWRRLA